MPKIGITCGDPAGVGPEIVARWLKQQSTLKPEEVVLIGYDHWIRQNRPTSDGPAISVGDPEFVPIPGEPSREGSRIALSALEEAAAAVTRGDVEALVTCPISKKWIQSAGFTYPGQTEFFAERWGGEPTMAFAGRKLKVSLVTWHIPLQEVPDAIDASALERAVRNSTRWLQRIGIESPRLGVCGLNPHAGEGGMLGSEEYDRINPILKDLQPTYPGLSLCEPGDTVFWRQLQGEFDLVIALYHDQGLAPLKTLEFDQAVNISLGLPFIRTSPDHGTAFDAAREGKAGIQSFSQAVTWAARLAGTDFSS